MSKVGVTVVIAAWNAAATITNAIASALAQQEVSEVAVVDDCSNDNTADVARAACDGTGRLKVFRQHENLGPSAARNLAISRTRAPLIAILDSDDRFLPGRFARLLKVRDWDVIADNIAIVNEENADSVDFLEPLERSDSTETLTFENFVQRNVSVRGRPRAELGFLKPVMRRDFLERHGLGYDPSLRLGEDYALYARMLAKGGRFLMTRRCGYLAVERAASLSGAHATRDLASLAASDEQLLGWDMSPRAHDAVQAHRASILLKHAHRRFLDAKARSGLARAILDATRRPLLIPGIVGAIAADKFAAPSLPSQGVRYLLG